MLKSQKDSNIWKDTFEINQHWLINDNLIIENQTIKRINSKYDTCCISGIIIKIYSNNSYKVKIVNNFKDILFENEVYYINIKMLKKVNEKVWKEIYNYNFDRVYDKERKNEDIDYYYSSEDNNDISNSDFVYLKMKKNLFDSIKSKKIKI